MGRIIRMEVIVWMRDNFAEDVSRAASSRYRAGRDVKPVVHIGLDTIDAVGGCNDVSRTDNDAITEMITAPPQRYDVRKFTDSGFDSPDGFPLWRSICD